MIRQRRAGMSLIELISVLAFIAIVVAFAFIGSPGPPCLAPLRTLNATMNELRTALAQYYADHGTYPPRYGYLDHDAYSAWEAAGFTEDTRPAGTDLFNLRSYLGHLGLAGYKDLYDNMSKGYDADHDGMISALEYSPVGVKDAGTGNITFDLETRYDGRTPDPETKRMREARGAPRPIIYIPVNRAQARAIGDYWIAKGDFLAETYDPADPDLPKLDFPPEQYDAFALISVGPAGNTFGITGLADSEAYRHVVEQFPREAYHLLALRTFFLATRDLNGNYQLDLVYSDRKKGCSSAITAGRDTRSQQRDCPRESASRDCPFLGGLKRNQRFFSPACRKTGTDPSPSRTRPLGSVPVLLAITYASAYVRR